MRRGRAVAERPELPEERDIPEARPASRRLSWGFLIWVVPIIAVAVGAWLALESILNRGPTIAVTFKTATGLEAGKTKVKYKDVDIGTVKSIVLSEDRRDVIVTAELTPQARGLIVEDTRFWVVRPRITGGQAFGLGTLLSGAFIALDPGKSKTSRRAFEGLENPPVVLSDVPGRQFVLRADDLGSIDVGSPVYYRHVRVGQVVTAELNRDGKGVSFVVFINAPYDRYVMRGTRFWNASGIDVSLGAGGFRMETESLASIVIGGVAFQVPPEADPGPPAEPEAAFDLYKDRETAFKQAVTVRDTYVLHFRQSVRGLVVGAPVDFRGVQVGEVSRVGLDFDRDRAELRPVVEINIYPERIAASFRKRQPVDRPDMRAQTVQRFVDRGLRAQLKTGNLITGQLYVTLDYFPNEPKVQIDLAAAPLELPTASGGFTELQSSVESIVRKIEKLPLDEIGADIRNIVKTLDATLRNVNALVERVDSEIAPELSQTLESARSALGQVQGALSDEAPLHGDLRGTLRDVARAAEAIRNLADYLERHPESLLRGRRDEEPSR
jgi:paraquat-inducible protein B